MRLLILCLLLTGCDYARTYSVYYRDGKQEVGGTVRIEPRGFKK